MNGKVHQKSTNGKTLNNKSDNSLWEFGSEFHYPSFLPLKHPPPAWPNRPTYWGSGRDAMRAICKFGKEHLNWKTLWLPNYFCQDVIKSISTVGIPLMFYPDSPLNKFPNIPWGDLSGLDAILVNNYFGLRPAMQYNDNRHKCCVIEDHTHDPWSNWAKKSSADYCLASLRKTLPVSDGGILWSPVNALLPKQLASTSDREAAAADKQLAMILKSLYLDGHPILKNDFRQLSLTGESHIAEGAVSGMTHFTQTIIPTMPIQKWRKIRRKNFNKFAQAIKQIDGIKLLYPHDEDCCPFSTIIIFSSSNQRSITKTHLINNNVYPAVLWPMDDSYSIEAISESSIQFSQTMLSLHCDFRYNDDDIARVVQLIKESITNNC